jgi:hypothetical protein
MDHARKSLTDMATRVSLVSVLLSELLDGIAEGRWEGVPPGVETLLQNSALSYADAMALLQPSVRRAEGPKLRLLPGGGSKSKMLLSE